MNTRSLLILAGAAVGLLLANSVHSNPKPMSTAEKTVTVRLLTPDGKLSEPIQTDKVVKSDEAWKTILTEEQFKVTRAHGTERAFCGIFHDNHKEGVYTCIGCGLPLFRSNAKFDSGTGWPSFFQPVAKENVETERDTSYGMVRDEIHCNRCDSHLGHVFEDGPPPSGLRYCINSASLNFREDGVKPKIETVIFGAGCFWGVEAAFAKVPGVVETKVGYSGGVTKKPTYEQVCSHKTGHAEVVEVKFDPSRVKLDELLEVFWANHDPTTPNRQGPDVGSQYRSAIFFTTPEQESVARASAERLQKSGKLKGAVSTEIASAGPFYLAEDYHQKYYLKHKTGTCRLP